MIIHAALAEETLTANQNNICFEQKKLLQTQKKTSYQLRPLFGDGWVKLDHKKKQTLHVGQDTVLEQKRYKRAGQVLQYAKIDYMH